MHKSPRLSECESLVTADASLRLKAVITAKRSPEEIRLVGFAAILSAAALSLIVGLVLSGSRLGPIAPVLALAALAYMAEREDVRLSARTSRVEEGTWLAVSFLPLVFAAVAFGPLAAIAVGALGLLAEFRRPYLRWAVWTSSRALVGGGAGLAALAIVGSGESSLAHFIAAAAAASLVDVIIDVALGGATVRVRGSGSFWGVVRTQGPLWFWALPFYAPVVAILAYAYREVSPWSVALFLGPAFLAQRFFVLYRTERDASAELAAANSRLARANLSFATALVTTLDARDRYTAGHSAAVAIYARDIASRMGLSESEQELAHLCGLVHDIGKIGLPPWLLEKSGPLSLEERRLMETHSEIGERILAKVEDYAEIAAIVRHHHERWDGHGYPDRIGGNEIPRLSRVIAVADAYNAMTSDRPYRDAMPSRVARLRLAQAADSQFDTGVVAAFEAILAGANEAYRLGLRDDFKFATQDALPAAAVATG
jgi:putative nucleotidyltransferase with HDIG domain